MPLKLKSLFGFNLLLCLAFCQLPLIAEETPLIIGATVSREGKYVKPSTAIERAYKLWVEEVNKRGGLLGRKVKLIVYDDKSNEEIAKERYKELVEKDKVDILLSPYSTPLTQAAMQVSEKHHMLMLAVAAASEKPWTVNARYLFQLYAPATRQFIGVLDLMARQNKKTLCLLYDDTSDFNIDVAKGIREWAKRYKLEIIFEAGYKDGQKELPSLVRKVKEKNPDGLIISAYPPDSYELMRLLKQMKYRPTVLAMPIIPVYPDFYEKAGEMANGVFAPSQWEPNERIHFPGTQKFLDAYKKAYGEMPSFHSASAYAACQLYEKAINHSGALNQQKMRDFIASLNTVTVLGRFKVDHSGKQVGHNSFIIQWQKGKKEIVWPQKMRTSQPILSH